MRILRPRLNVRRLMVATAIVGLISAVEVGRRRRTVFLAKIEQHWKEELQFLELANFLENTYQKTDSSLASVTGSDAGVEALRRKLAERRDRKRASVLAIAQYHALLREKYRKAARFPWLYVSPDPAGPADPFPRLEDPFQLDPEERPIDAGGFPPLLFPGEGRRVGRRRRVHVLRIRKNRRPRVTSGRLAPYSLAKSPTAGPRGCTTPPGGARAIDRDDRGSPGAPARPAQTRSPGDRATVAPERPRPAGSGRAPNNRREAGAPRASVPSNQPAGDRRVAIGRVE